MGQENFSRTFMATDQIHALLESAVDQLEAAKTVDDLKPVLRALLQAQINALPGHSSTWL